MFSEDKELRKLAEEQRKQQELEERLRKGILETREGHRIFPSPDRSRFGVVPRTVNAQLNWEHLLERAFENASFVAQYSYDAFCRMVIVLLQHIPEEDQDEQFKEEIEKATIITKYPTGRYGGFGGNTYEIMETVKEYDYLRIFRAIVNLLRRRGVIVTPRIWEENLTEVFWKREGKNKPMERIRRDEIIEDAKE